MSATASLTDSINRRASVVLLFPLLLVTKVLLSSSANRLSSLQTATEFAFDFLSALALRFAL